MMHKTFAPNNCHPNFTKLFFFLLLFITAALCTSAQNEKPFIFGNISNTDFNLPNSPLIDSNTNAVIIADVGSTGFVGNKNSNWVSYVFKKHTRIKILNNKAFDVATVKVHLYGKGDKQDKITDIQASTYNVDNGQTVETKLNPADIFDEKITGNVSVRKFTMPNIKAGSIIEYSYTVTSLHYWWLPYWSFQHTEYPCLYSEFQIAIPDLLRYITVFHGVDSFSQRTNEEGYETINMSSVKVGSAIHKHKWVIKNVAPFGVENYINTPFDYVDKLEFHLIQTYDGKEVASNIDWKEATDELLKREDFGAAIEKDNAANLSNTVEKITADDGTDVLKAARHIYSYVRDNFTCISNDQIYIDRDLYEVNKSKKGNVAELNLLLTALLRQRGINAAPVILSTTGYGKHPANYPVLDKMNYVICRARLFGQNYYLDATQPQLGFGRLSSNCYNGHARIIDAEDSSSVYFYADSLQEQKVTTVSIFNDEKEAGTLNGNMQNVPGYLNSYDIRQEVSSKGQNEFFKNIQQDDGSEIPIRNMAIDSLKDLDKPVKVHYDFTIKPGAADDIIYFNPVIGNRYDNNPFTAAERKYPVEMAYPIDETYVLTMEIPSGYVVDEVPKSARVAYNGNEGFFEYIIKADETNVRLRTYIKFKQAIFEAEDYNSLRDFFTYIVKKQTEQVVFKKKK